MDIIKLMDEMMKKEKIQSKKFNPTIVTEHDAKEIIKIFGKLPEDFEIVKFHKLTKEE